MTCSERSPSALESISRSPLLSGASPSLCSSWETAPACTTRERSRPNRKPYGVSAKKTSPSRPVALSSASGPLTASS